MNAETLDQVKKAREDQKAFFASGKTTDIGYRLESLIRLRESVKSHNDEIKQALQKDLNKSSFEAYATETGIVLHEIRIFLKHLRRWARPRTVKTPLFAFPSRSKIVPESYGCVYIISPWNYPFQLPMVPLVGAVAAGNVVIIRQSRFSPATNTVIRKILSETFVPGHVSIIETDVETAEEVYRLKWDMIFFTGSTTVGKKIYSAAALNLTPVVLELGGKSPVVVDEDAVLPVAARRIIWAKLINAGQTCISPDYLYVHKNIKDKLVYFLKQEITRMFGENPLENPDYPKLISARALGRIKGYFENSVLLSGGRSDEGKPSLEPTLIEAAEGDLCMREEIFGPLLPILTFIDIAEVIHAINAREKPLAVYYFSRRGKNRNRMLKETSSGAFLSNDLVVHIANTNLPFGGVGESGTGRYHGFESFRAFSNMKAVMSTSPLVDIPLKYPPFGRKERLIRLFLR